jgi:simple sugar transport system ATP-binding protein
VLRAGRVVAVVDPLRESAQSLAALMLGGAPPAVAAPARVAGAPALEARGLHAPGLVDVSLQVAAGEVVGVAGISGNGQGALLEALSGEGPVAAGTVTLLGREVTGANAAERRARGLGYVPEERLGHGAVPALSLAANCLLTRRELVGRGGWLRLRQARALASHLIERFGITAAGPDAPASSLSGGNLQKLIVGREVDAAPRVLLVAQPTWGLDVGAAAQIRNALLALAGRGCAVLVVSEDLEELFELCSALTVMAGGRLSPRVPVREVTLEQIGRQMGGL